MKYFPTMLNGCVSECSSNSTVWGKHTNSCQFNLGYWWCHKRASLSLEAARPVIGSLRCQNTVTKLWKMLQNSRYWKDWKPDMETKPYGNKQKKKSFFEGVCLPCFLCLFRLPSLPASHCFLVPVFACASFWGSTAKFLSAFFRGLHSFHSVATRVAGLTSGAKAAAGQIELDKAETPPRDGRPLCSRAPQITQTSSAQVRVSTSTPLGLCAVIWTIECRFAAETSWEERKTERETERKKRWKKRRCKWRMERYK